MASPQKSSSKFPKFPKALAAAGLAAVLVGCGGGGGSETARTGSDEMVPMPIKDAKGELATAEGAVNALPADATYEQKRDAWKKVRDKADDLEVVLKANNGSDGDISQARLTSIRANENYEKQVKYITAINKIKGSYNTVKSLVDGLTASSSPSTVTSVRGQVNGFLEDVRKEANLPESEREKYTRDGSKLLGDIADKDKDIKDETTRLANFNLWNTAVEGYTVSSSVPADPNPIGALPDPAGGGTSTLRTNSGGTFNFAYDGGNLPGTAVTGLPAGWKGTNFSRGYANGRNDSGRIFTNRGGNERTTWGDLFAKHRRAARNYLGNGVTFTNPNAAAGGVITTSATTAVGVAKNTMIHRSVLGTLNPAVVIGTPAYFNPTAGEVLNDGVNYVGTLFDKPGSFQCSVGAGDTCTINFDANGFLTVESTAIGGTVAFTPAQYNAAGKVNPTVATVNAFDNERISWPDLSFATFGYWALINPKATPASIKLETFATGFYGDTNRGLAANTGILSGTARYNGLSGGYYVLDGNGGQNGRFMANVELNANFDSDTISGAVKGFKSVTDTSHTLWSSELELESTAISFATFSGSTDANDGAVKGVWQGVFYGNAGTGTSSPTDNHPKAVVGEFSGNFTNGHVAGAFGAETPEK